MISVNLLHPKSSGCRGVWAPPAEPTRTHSVQCTHLYIQRALDRKIYRQWTEPPGLVLSNRVVHQELLDPTHSGHNSHQLLLFAFVLSGCSRRQDGCAVHRRVSHRAMVSKKKKEKAVDISAGKRGRTGGRREVRGKAGGCTAVPGGLGFLLRCPWTLPKTPRSRPRTPGVATRWAVPACWQRVPRRLVPRSKTWGLVCLPVNPRSLRDGVWCGGGGGQRGSSTAAGVLLCTTTGAQSQVFVLPAFVA